MSRALFCAITSNRERHLRFVVRNDRIGERALSGDEKWVMAYETYKAVGQSFDQSFDPEECLALIVHANLPHRSLGREIGLGDLVHFKVALFSIVKIDCTDDVADTYDHRRRRIVPIPGSNHS